MTVSHDEQGCAETLPHVGIVGGERVKVGVVGQQGCRDGEVLRSGFYAFKLAAGRNEQRGKSNLRCAIRLCLCNGFRWVGHGMSLPRPHRSHALRRERTAQLPIREGGLQGVFDAANVGRKGVRRRAVGNGNQDFLAHKVNSFQKEPVGDIPTGIVRCSLILTLI